MNTSVPNLNILDALKNSLSFCVKFAQTHWIITTLFTIFWLFNSLFANWMVSTIKSESGLSALMNPLTIAKTMFDPRFLLPNILLICFGAISSYLLMYYAIRMAVGQLNSAIGLSDKSLLKSIWQLFCMHLVIGIISVPLYLLLIIPGIWWSIKMSVATINLLSTDDGPIASMKKSFQFTDKKFWSCCGYLLGIFALPAIVLGATSTIITLSLSMSKLFSAYNGLQDDWGLLCIHALTHALSMVLQVVIAYFCQSWLYIYLKTQAESIINS